MRRLLTLLLPLALFTAACSDSNPAAPSSNPAPSNTESAAPTAPPASPSGATISGALQGATATNAVRVSAAGGVTVQVSGTTLSTSTDGQGRFTLSNVPDGTQQLQFSGSGVNGSVTVADLKTGDAVELAVSVDSGGVTLDSSRRSSGTEEEIEGRVEAIPSTGTFVVAGRTVTTSSGTQFFLNGGSGRIEDVVIGVRVHVKGSSAGGGVLAAIVKVQNTNTSLPANVNGIVSGFTGTASAFTFFVGTREVRGDASTEFFGNSAFSDLRNTARVEVKGQQRDGYVYAVRLHVEDSTGDEGGSVEPDEFRGTLTSVSGTVAPLTLVVGGRTVQVTAATEIRRRGDLFTPAVLRVGLTVEISGKTLAGVFTAKKVTIEDSTLDVDVEGAVTGPVTGSCASGSITFKVGALTLKTTSFTEFKKTTCGAIVAGAPVKVRGVLLPGGTSAEVARIEVK